MCCSICTAVIRTNGCGPGNSLRNMLMVVVVAEYTSSSGVLRRRIAKTGCAPARVARRDDRSFGLTAHHSRRASHITSAIQNEEQYNISFWDGLILAAAQ